MAVDPSGACFEGLAFASIIHALVAGFKITKGKLAGGQQYKGCAGVRMAIPLAEMKCYAARMENRSLNDVGGTPGGLGQFLLGFAMACIGGFLITHQVSIIGSYWAFWGGATFGVTLLPMLFGIGILFWNGRNVFGWLLTVAGALFIFAGIIANLHIYFQPTSLFNTLVMLILLVGGLVLIARSLRPHSSKQSPQ